MVVKPKGTRSPVIASCGWANEIDELSRSVPEGPSDLEDFFLKGLFPRLDLGRWVTLLLDELKEGEVMTYGAAAAALGAPRGARAIAEWVSLGRVVGPTDKLVSKEELGPGFVLVTPVMEHPPFLALARVQTVMGPMLEPHDGMVRGSYLGLDISTLGNDQASCLVEVSKEGVVGAELARSSEPFLPYVPGFLFYKEAPCLMPLVREAARMGVSEESVLVLDGNGTIHPRGMGIACQMGIALDMPSMGIAKKLLCGRAGPWEAADNGVMVSRIERSGCTIGYGSRAQKRRPLYVSRGNRTSQEECLEISKAIIAGALPSHTKLAHDGANKARRSKP